MSKRRSFLSALSQQKDRTPLHVASKHGNLPAVSTLLESDAQVSPSDMVSRRLDHEPRLGARDIEPSLAEI